MFTIVCRCECKEGEEQKYGIITDPVLPIKIEYKTESEIIVDWDFTNNKWKEGKHYQTLGSDGQPAEVHVIGDLPYLRSKRDKSIADNLKELDPCQDSDEYMRLN